MAGFPFRLMCGYFEILPGIGGKNEGGSTLETVKNL